MKRRRPFNRGLFALAVLAAGLGGRPADAQPALAAGVEAEIQRTMKRERIVGMSAVVLAGGEELLVKGFGLADRERGLPATEQTLFPLGSITKLFTATAVMQLAERGQVDLDAPVCAYLEGFAPLPSPAEGRLRTGPITVRQLLTHHSGLPSNRFDGFQPDAPSAEGYRRLPELLSAEHLAAAPGTVFSYSNLNYALLGRLVERVSGLSYDQYLRRHLFAPLGMDSTCVLVDALPPVPGASRGYRGREELAVYPIRDVPAGAALSSAADMAAFLRMILGRGESSGARILEAESFGQMTRRQNGGVALDREFSIGLGYWLIDPFGVPEPLASHGGDLPPFHAILITVPEAGVAVYLAANSESSRGVIIDLAARVVRLVYEAGTGRSIPAPVRGSAVALDAAAARDLAGTYASPMGLLELRSRGARLSLRLEGLPLPLRLVPRQGGQWTLELRLAGLVVLPLRSLEGVRLSPFTHEGSQYFGISAAGIAAGAAQRLERVPPHPEWVSRVGAYEVQGGSAGLRRNLRDIRLDHDRRRGLLVFSCSLVGQRMSYALSTVDGTRAVIAGKGSGLGDTLEWVEEQPAGPAAASSGFLRWSGLRLVRCR